MNDPRPESILCGKAKATLHDLWIDGHELPSSPPRDLRRAAAQGESRRAVGLAATEGLQPLDAEFWDHVAKCSSCQGEAQQLSQLGTSLKTGLGLLGRSVKPGMEERIASALEVLHETPPGVGMFRRLRRGVRLVLLISAIALISLSFIAFCLLAMRLYQRLMEG